MTLNDDHKSGLIIGTVILAIFALIVFSPLVYSEEIGSVDTEWKMLGSNHRIAVEVFDDPQVEGAACYVSRSVKGGMNWFVEETSDSSIACRQVGPTIQIKPGAVVDLGKRGDLVFSEKRSPLFKSLNVVRYFDCRRGVFVYVTYSTKMINGSAKNSVSVIPLGHVPAGCKR